MVLFRCGQLKSNCVRKRSKLLIFKNIPLLTHQVTCFLVTKKISINLNPAFGTSTSGIEISPNGHTTVNFDANLTKVIDGKLMVTIF
jgi:hypothetical protein